MASRFAADSLTAIDFEELAAEVVDAIAELPAGLTRHGEIMDPVTLILTALAAGAAAGLQGTAGEAIKDLYAGLKARLRAKLQGNEPAEAQLTAVADGRAPDARALEPYLRAGAADDELVRLARELMTRLDPDGARAGKYTVTVTGGKGVVIGDNASVTMNFND